MSAIDVSAHTHGHNFLGSDHRRNEGRVWLVIGLTAAMMVAEIGAGAIYGSMALIADGWHMSTHAGAMLITALTYLYARRHAADPRFTFGTGKLGDLGAFASAIILALVALLIGWESLTRLANPVAISFEQAIAVACLGLVVNLVCAWLLRDDHSHHHGHGHAHHHHDDDGAHGHSHDGRHNHARDNNLRAAYLHVLADALTSILAIAALLAGRSYGWNWADPAMGVVGALVIARWSWGLIRDSGGVLLDRTPDSDDLPGQIRSALETEIDRIADLHVWQVGPGHHAAIVSLVSSEPRQPSAYKSRLAKIGRLSHVTVEVDGVNAGA
ncbi:CDF family Co(II)/Ni(II) efflux transporter DmeF [Pelagibacterium flavum]|uniref:CDF family Co(II)/Ni(II) efflux transporter DmeF n=1 Tax=Pelagibacterium flavum TaxID=2984530 RepID=A0ABY6IL80_9HYPH|nr:CDF family Co(II)/Ni(II) efflux transporter DmeF [Pelagibacterium sp. YIM 151497]MAN77133.1 cation transporter [Hyphomicrobiales bacterium]UYQ71346.1 CDF family Co(II)/Ni(II) efflux transporter DmeF [Pelagibacterium sp. YIM 151497]|tara:strand:+ start:1562 stop:2542 length:981 start_codon:yes stop_codon:yes gene_type:complete